MATSSGSVKLRVGVVYDAGETGLFMLPATAKAAGFKFDDYLQVDSAERGTQIIRRLVRIRGSGLDKNYVYFDQQSAHYILCDLHEFVEVRKSDHSMDIP